MRKEVSIWLAHIRSIPDKGSDPDLKKIIEQKSFRKHPTALRPVTTFMPLWVKARQKGYN